MGVSRRRVVVDTRVGSDVGSHTTKNVSPDTRPPDFITPRLFAMTTDVVRSKGKNILKLKENIRGREEDGVYLLSDSKPSDEK